MADQTELRMNLVAIKRVDPYAKDIVNSSAHVALYVFNNAENEWEKTDIEGALFIYSRFAEPYHSIFINNRLNTNSLVEPIRGQIELQSKPPFLLYRNERSRIRGFWFYNNTECDRIGEVIQKLVTECGDGDGGGGGGESRPPMNGADTSVPAGIYPGGGGGGVTNGSGGEGESTNVDIFTMLTKAQEDFQNNATVPPNGGAVLNHHAGVMMGAHPGQGIAIPQQQHQQQQQHPQQQQQQQQPITNQNAPRSVVNFFAAAKQPAASEVPLFKTLAPVHTLEQIEKQHRATTPQKETTTAAASVTATGKVTPDVSELESSFKRMGIPIVGGGSNNNGPQTPSGGMPELGTSPLATFINAANLSAAMRGSNHHHQPVVPKTKLIEISELESRQNAQQQQQQQPQQTPLHELLKKSDPIGGTGGSGATVVKPALMPPTMFKPTATAATPATEALSSLLLGPPSTPSSTNSPAGAGKQQQQQQQGNGTPGGQTKAAAGSTPLSSTGKQHRSSAGGKQQASGTTPPKGAFTTVTSNSKALLDFMSEANSNLKNNNNSSGAGGNAATVTAAGGVEPLTQNQLIQAVSYLIKHDPDFVRKLHEAYVKSFTEMISN